jgi:hypothetical protein
LNEGIGHSATLAHKTVAAAISPSEKPRYFAPRLDATARNNVAVSPDDVPQPRELLRWSGMNHLFV